MFLTVHDVIRSIRVFQLTRFPPLYNATISVI